MYKIGKINIYYIARFICVIFSWSFRTNIYTGKYFLKYLDRKKKTKYYISGETRGGGNTRITE